MVDRLTEDQKEFKKVVQYLHSNSEYKALYDFIGLKGINDGKIVDKMALRESYSNYFLKNKKKNSYELFMDMHNGLETLGIVKGKPKKQKFVNLLNDGRHSFFSAYCDIFVTNDADLVNKTKFMFELFDIETNVLAINEFEDYLKSAQSKSDNFIDLIAEINNSENLENIFEEVINENAYSMKKLSRVYFNFFDTFGFVKDRYSRSFFFSKRQTNFSKIVLIKDIEKVTNDLKADLGQDLFEQGYFNNNEMNSDKWPGRSWQIKGMKIHLSFDQDLLLSFTLPNSLDSTCNIQLDN